MLGYGGVLFQEHSGEDALGRKVEEMCLGAVEVCILRLASIGGGRPAAGLSRPDDLHVAPGPKISGALPGAALPPPAAPLHSLSEEPERL